MGCGKSLDSVFFGNSSVRHVLHIWGFGMGIYFRCSCYFYVLLTSGIGYGHYQVLCMSRCEFFVGLGLVHNAVITAGGGRYYGGLGQLVEWEMWKERF